MDLRVSETWVNPERALGLRPLTEAERVLVGASMAVSSTNYVMHVRARPVGPGLFRPNAIWDALRNVNAVARTESYGIQHSMRFFNPDLGIEFTIMTSRDDKDDRPVPAEQATCKICILGVKDFATACVVANSCVYELFYQLTGVRYRLIDSHSCNTMFVASIPGATVDIQAMAVALTELYCIMHENIENVTMTVQIVVRGEERTATCNIWTTGSINIMGVPDEESCRLALSVLLPVIVRFSKRHERPPEPKPMPVPRSAHTLPIDRQFAWGLHEASRFRLPVTSAPVHPYARRAETLHPVFITAGMPVPLIRARAVETHEGSAFS